jgi:hypothetical protein
LQKSVTANLRFDAQALAVFRPTGYKTAFFSGCCCNRTGKTGSPEVLQQLYNLYALALLRLPWVLSSGADFGYDQYNGPDNWPVY